MYDKKSILAIIPARGGSKGVPRKNIKILAGKPMIVWSIEAAKRSKYIDRIIVSTEDEEIRDISIKNGAEIPFVRPKELARDDTSSVDVILYALNKIIEDEKKEYDFILLLQPTSPLRTEKHIDEAIENFMRNFDEFNSLISITELEHPIYWNRSIGNNNKLEKIIEYDKSQNYRRQDFEGLYRLNGAIYIIKTDAFLKYKNFETENTMVFVMDRRSSIDIDCIDDFELAEFYLKKRNAEL